MEKLTSEQANLIWQRDTAIIKRRDLAKNNSLETASSLKKMQDLNKELAKINRALGI